LRHTSADPSDLLHTRARWLAVLACLLTLAVGVGHPVVAQSDSGIEFDTGSIVLLSGTPVQVTAAGPTERLSSLVLRLTQNGASRDYPAVEVDGVAVFEDVLADASGLAEMQLWDEVAVTPVRTVRVWPSWISIVPPLLAIALALLFKQVIVALFIGLWLGAAALVVTAGGAVVAPFGPTAIVGGVLDAFQVYVLGSVTTVAYAQILLFSFMVGGTVGIIIKNGGMQGVVNILVKFATDSRRGQIAAGTLGLAIFFDDYANTLVVGNTMRQVTDRLRISREKLAYIVDSTAAPVACVALVTTWIGYEVGLIESTINRIPEIQESAYSIFLNSVAYSFYPFLTMFMVFTLAVLGRDYGPMLKAERRARSTGAVLAADADVDESAGAEVPELTADESKPVRAINAVLPIGVLVGTVIVALFVTGEGDTLRDIVGSADSYIGLMWGSILATVTAALLSLGQRILTSKEIVDAWYAGMKAMLFAMIILVLAWSLAKVSTELHTAEYLVSILGDWLHPGVVPTTVFLLAAATAFSTGSSWSTMGILMPLVVPLVWAVVSTSADPAAGMAILYSAISCVLAGAVMGDHCSPISDTTILSSMASGCDHIAHVRTQLPYAATVGVVAVLLGTLPAGFGMPWWLGMVMGAAALYCIARFVGQPVDA